MTAQDSMVERVARVIARVEGDGRDYSVAASAVIEEMRVPTIYMMNMGGREVPEGSLQAEKAWVRMIDAALSEEGERG